MTLLSRKDGKNVHVFAYLFIALNETYTASHCFHFCLIMNIHSMLQRLICLVRLLLRPNYLNFFQKDSCRYYFEIKKMILTKSTKFYFKAPYSENLEYIY